MVVKDEESEEESVVEEALMDKTKELGRILEAKYSKIIPVVSTDWVTIGEIENVEESAMVANTTETSQKHSHDSLQGDAEWMEDDDVVTGKLLSGDKRAAIIALVREYSDCFTGKKAPLRYVPLTKLVKAMVRKKEGMSPFFETKVHRVAHSELEMWSRMERMKKRICTKMD